MMFFTAASLLAALALPAPVAASGAVAPRLEDPRLGHRSAFRQAPLTSLDLPVQDWRLSNDTVRVLAGHAGHLRTPSFANPPDAARSAATAPAKP